VHGGFAISGIGEHIRNMIFLNKFLQPVLQVLTDEFTGGKFRDYIHVFRCPSAFTIDAVERAVF
jgi:hypothetical protein